MRNSTVKLPLLTGQACCSHYAVQFLASASQFHEGNFHGQPSQGCRQWETGNNGISQFVLSTESEWGPCICPTKDEQRSTKLGKLPSSVVSYIGINKDDGQVYLLHDQILIQLAIKCHCVPSETIPGCQVIISNLVSV